MARYIATVLIGTLILLGSTLLASEHRELRHLRQQAEILPLEEIVRHLQLQPSERLLEVEYEYEDGHHIYEIEYISTDGAIMEVEVDAQTGEVLKRERE